MAFVINKIKGAHVDVIAGALQRKLAQSRFSARVEVHRKNVSIHDIRLHKKKDYCGNHPLPCPVRPFPKPHMRLPYLEGADWVGFNDMVNDVLDSLGVVCNVGSKLVNIRREGKRCTRYDAQGAPNGIDNEWQKDSGQYVDNLLGKPMKASYPKGTPGFAEWQGEWDYPEDHHH